MVKRQQQLADNSMTLRQQFPPLDQLLVLKAKFGTSEETKQTVIQREQNFAGRRSRRLHLFVSPGGLLVHGTLLSCESVSRLLATTAATATTGATGSAVKLREVIHRLSICRHRSIHGFELFLQKVGVLRKPVLFLLQPYGPRLGIVIEGRLLVCEQAVSGAAVTVREIVHNVHHALAIGRTGEQRRNTRWVVRESIL